MKKSQISLSSSLDFLNGKYQGHMKLFSCENYGIFLWDDGFFYLGQWKRNKIHGKGLFIYPNGSYIYSTFSDDQLNGLAIMKFNTGNIMIGNWQNNKKNGLFLYFENEKKNWTLNDHNIIKKTTEVLCEEIQKGRNLPLFLEKFPALKSLISENIFALLNDDIKERDDSLIYVKTEEELEYFGFTSQNNIANGLGVFKKGDKIICFGDFEKGVMRGFGRVFMDSTIYDGVFQEGYLHGMGVQYKINEKIYTFGEYHHNVCKNVLSTGEGFPKNLLSEFKSDLHRKNKAFYERSQISKMQTLFKTKDQTVNVSINEQSEVMFKSERTKKKSVSPDKKNSASPDKNRDSIEKNFLSPPKSRRSNGKSSIESPKKSKSSIPKVYPFHFSDQNNKKASPPKKSALKVEKPNNIMKSSQKEKTKKNINQNTSEISETKKFFSEFQPTNIVAPIKSKKVEGIYGLENQILHEIKANGLLSLKKELVDPTEESRNSVNSLLKEDITRNLMERFEMMSSASIKEKPRNSKVEQLL